MAIDRPRLDDAAQHDHRQPGQGQAEPHVHTADCGHDHGPGGHHHHHPIQETYVRAAPKVGRNDPCPCGSGDKYKKCCMA